MWRSRVRSQTRRTCCWRTSPPVTWTSEPSGIVFDALLDVVRTQGVAALIATHNPDLARRMDRRVTLRDGAVVEA